MVGRSGYLEEGGENYHSYINNSIYLSLCCAIVIYT